MSDVYEKPKPVCPDEATARSDEGSHLWLGISKGLAEGLAAVVGYLLFVKLLWDPWLARYSLDLWLLTLGAQVAIAFCVVDGVMREICESSMRLFMITAALCMLLCCLAFWLGNLLSAHPVEPVFLATGATLGLMYCFFRTMVD